MSGQFFPVFQIAAAVPNGQGLTQIGELALAFGLSALIGLEREWRHKAAGLRTYTLVGLGAAGFVIVSKYGFTDVLGPRVVLDPSRVTAGIVTGIGFIGGGLIFVRGDAVRGLTTATIVWTTTAIGMACGAGLALIALALAAAHFIIVLLFPWLAVRLPHSRFAGSTLRLVYAEGRGVLREVLAECTRLGFAIERVDTHQLARHVQGVPAVAVTMVVSGGATVGPLTVALSEVEGVLEVASTDPGADSE